MAPPPTSARTDGAGAARSVLGALWRRGQHGWPTGFPVAQFPNPPLIVALLASFISSVAEGEANSYARAAFYVGLSAWAWGELSSGVNWFRHGLGASGLAYVTYSLAAALAERT